MAARPTSAAIVPKSRRKASGDYEGLGCSWSRGVSGYREFVSEVFFPLPGMVSGVRQADFADGGNASRFYRDLSRLRAMDIDGVLLLDSACYGGDVVSEPFFKTVERGVQTVKENIHLKAVVTMTPPLAEFLKKAFPKLEVRASVNERIGFVNQMEYAGRCYDGFYFRSGLSRDLRLVEKARKWCDANGKTLHLVANSGCLYECPFFLEHLNTMGHQAEIASSGSDWSGRAMQCREALADKANHVVLYFWRLNTLYQFQWLYDCYCNGFESYGYGVDGTDASFCDCEDGPFRHGHHIWRDTSFLRHQRRCLCRSRDRRNHGRCLAVG